MSMRDLISVVLGNLRRMRSRVIMTAAGVAIGTAAVLVLISLGAGLQRQTQASMMSGGGLTEIRIFAPIDYLTGGGPGSGPMMPMPGGGMQEMQIVDDRVLQEIREIPGVATVLVSEPLQAQGEISFKGLQGYPSIYGLEREALEALGVTPASGTLDLRRGQAVIGARVAESTLFDPRQRQIMGPVPTSGEREIPDLQGAMLRLKLIRYSADGTLSEKTVRLEVVGVLKPVGWRHDYNIYVPLRDVLEFNTWAQGKRRDPSRQGYAEVLVKSTSARETLEVEQVLTERGLSVYSERQQVEQANAYFAQVQAVLGGIGGIALLVAAFGIANTMLMAIYERTREIGLMKAIGASNKDVMNVFLAEAGGIGLLGGLAGIVLGMFVNVVINMVGRSVAATQIAAGAVDMGNRTGITYTPLWLPLFTIIFAGLVGVLSGAYPASRAASLSPIRALKYE